MTEEAGKYLDGDTLAAALRSGIHRVLGEQDLLNRINVFPVADRPGALPDAIERIREEAERHTREGARVIILTDRAVDEDHAAIPMLLAVSAVVTAESLNILDVHSKTWEVGVGSAFQYKVLIADVDQLERLIASLEAMDDVVRVIRGDMDDMLHDLGSDGFWQNAIP